MASGHHRTAGGAGVSTPHDDLATAVIASFVIALCDDPDCKPSDYRLCADCERILDASYPDRCPDPDCFACRRPE